jgi:hypothetical protein
LVIENQRFGKLPNFQITQLPNEEIWLSASRGLRGSFRALSGARKLNLVALETWSADNESET